MRGKGETSGWWSQCCEFSLMLWHCWLGYRKVVWSEKQELVSCWDGWPCQSKVGRKVAVGCCAPFYGGGKSPSNTVSPRPRPTSVASSILMYPTVCPQYTNATDRQDNGPVASGEPLLVKVAQNPAAIFPQSFSFGGPSPAWGYCRKEGQSNESWVYVFGCCALTDWLWNA